MMPTPFGKSEPDLSHFVCTVGGVLAGSWLVRTQIAESKKSRAELDDPDLAQEAYDDVDELLDDWDPDPECENEDDYTRDLCDFLRENSDWKVKLYSHTSEGKPDIVVGDLLALELKLDPTKCELDRGIGQCAAYSREWITCMVVIGAKERQIERLTDLLTDKGLEQIEVWDFS
jgi:hypothetical protein